MGLFMTHGKTSILCAIFVLHPIDFLKVENKDCTQNVISSIDLSDKFNPIYKEALAK